MKTVEVVAAMIRREGLWYATQRGYGRFEGLWEFPGGKIEPGETPEEALRREIREELEVEINVGELLCTVEYDYPDFHLSMRCFLCTLPDADSRQPGHVGETLEPTLVEAKSARWTRPEDLPTLDWLPADWQIIPLLQKIR